MTSGTTESKKKYSRDQVIQKLYEYQKSEAAKFAAAQRAFEDANKKTTDRLAKEGVPLIEFTDYVIAKERTNDLLD